jgi:transposase
VLYLPETVRLAREKIVFDRFNVLQRMMRAVDTVRKRERRGLLEDGDERLRRTKNHWLPSTENGGESGRPFFEQLPASALKTARASAIKDNVRNLLSYTTPGWMKQSFERDRSWAVRSRLPPVVNAARILSRKVDNIRCYCRNPTTNAVAESLNT